MATYSFKSVGKTQAQIQTEAVEQTLVPYGIKTPLELGNKDGIFVMNYDLSRQLADNLKNLLTTNWGERLGLYQFGANLKPLTTEYSSQEDFDSQAIERIKNAVEKWMPFIELDSFSSTADQQENTSTGVIKINVTYNIPSLEIASQGIQIVLYVI